MKLSHVAGAEPGPCSILASVSSLAAFCSALHVGLAFAARHALICGEGRLAPCVRSGGGRGLPARTIVLVLRPIHMLARDAKKIAQGNLEHRVEWISRDDFGVIASELNRIAVRLRDLRDSEAGRRADGVSALRRRAAVHLRADHRDRRQGPRAQSQSGRGRNSGRRCDRPHGAHDHPRRRENPERHSRRCVHAESGGRRRRSGPAAHAHRQAGTQLSLAHHADARLGWPPAGHRHHA